MPIYARAHQEIDHVWSEDPALDTDFDGLDDEARKAKLQAIDEGYAELRRTGSIAKLPLRNGMKPCVWKLKSLTHAQKLQLSDAMSQAAAQAEMVGRRSMGAKPVLYAPCAEAVAFGLVAVTGMLDNDGQPLKLERVAGRLTPDTMEKLSYDPLIVELGARIFEISSPDPTRGQA